MGIKRLIFNYFSDYQYRRFFYLSVYALYLVELRIMFSQMTQHVQLYAVYIFFKLYKKKNNLYAVLCKNELKNYFEQLYRLSAQQVNLFPKKKTKDVLSHRIIFCLFSFRSGSDQYCHKPITCLKPIMHKKMMKPQIHYIKYKYLQLRTRQLRFNA